MSLFQENNTSLAHSSVNFDRVLIHITFILFDTKKVFLVSATLRNQLQWNPAITNLAITKTPL